MQGVTWSCLDTMPLPIVIAKAAEERPESVNQDKQHQGTLLSKREQGSCTQLWLTVQLAQLQSRTRSITLATECCAVMTVCFDRKGTWHAVLIREALHLKQLKAIQMTHTHNPGKVGAAICCMPFADSALLLCIPGWACVALVLTILTITTQFNSAMHAWYKSSFARPAWFGIHIE